MPEYRVNFGVTYRVEAQDDDQAIDIAAEMAGLDWGIPFMKNAWIDAEEIEYA